MADTRLEYDRLTERISDAYCAVDTEWRISYWNDRMAEWTGTSADAVAGELFWDVCPAFRGSEIESHCRDVMDTQESRSFETTLPAPIDRPVEIACYADESGLSIISRDISERQMTQAQYELAETLFENTQDALFLIGVDEPNDEFRLERINPAYERNTGLRNADVSGRRFRDLFGDTQASEFLDNYRECVARGEPIEYEEVVSIPNKKSCWETRLAPVIVDGTTEKIVGATRNITDRKARERQYDAIFNQTYQFTGLLSVDGTLLEANDSALTFGGFQRDEVIGKPLWETEWWQGSVARQKKLQTAIESAVDGAFVRYDEEVQGATETTFIDFSLRPITDEQDEVTHLVAEGRDITDHKRQSRELARSREFLDQVQQIAAIGGWEFEFETERSQWTDELYRILGVDPDVEPTVEEALRFYHPQDRPTIAAAFERLQATGEPYDLEGQVMTNDDEVLWVRTLGTPWYDDAGELVGARGAFQDITDRKERERELQRTNARLEEFTSVVSHDLRNPLTVAQASLELGRESEDPADFDRVEAAHERINALITDLLTLAREGRQVEATRPVVLEEVIEAARETIPSDQATIDVELDDYCLDADESRLRQLVENLLSNAVRHGGEDVTVRIGVLPDDAGFYVADDGPGIPPSMREDVFTQGYSTARDGSGFGLAIVRAVAEAHGWTVKATEGAAGGARFEVTVTRSTQSRPVRSATDR